jgi:hypothetical protein
MLHFYLLLNLVTAALAFLQSVRLREVPGKQSREYTGGFNEGRFYEELWFSLR